MRLLSFDLMARVPSCHYPFSVYCVLITFTWIVDIVLWNRISSLLLCSRLGNITSVTQFIWFAGVSTVSCVWHISELISYRGSFPIPISARALFTWLVRWTLVSWLQADGYEGDELPGPGTVLLEWCVVIWWIAILNFAPINALSLFVSCIVPLWIATSFCVSFLFRLVLFRYVGVIAHVFCRAGVLVCLFVVTVADLGLCHWKSVIEL